MMTLKEVIRNYVLDHNKVVTNSEVKNYIQNKTSIRVSENNIRITLWRVLKEEGGRLKRNGLREEIRFYLMEQCNKGNHDITTSDIAEFIYFRGYEVSRHHISVATCQISKEFGIKLKQAK